MHGTLAPFTARIERKSLADALKLMAKVVEKRNSIPILACVLLESTGSSVTVRASDLDIFASVELPADAQPGRAVAVDMATLKAAVSKAKAEFVTLTDVGGGFVTFRDGETGATLRMPAREASDFPRIVMEGLGDSFAFPAPQLASDLGRVRVAVSTEETRYYLNGIFFHRTADEYGRDVLRMAATDGHRLARITRDVPEGMPESFPDAIVPRKCCDVMAHALNKADGTARLAFSASKVRFSCGRTVIESKLIDGTFPDYSRVIPSHWERTVTIPAATLADASKGVTAHASGRTKAAKFSWDSRAGWMTAFATCPDNGPAMMQVDGAEFDDKGTEGGEFTIGANATYLAELMGKWEGQPVSLHCSDAACPVLITAYATPEYIQVLMPMRVDGPVITPDYIARLNRSPVDTFVQDAPAVIERLAAIETNETLSSTGKRYARRDASRDLARLVQGAIAHKVAGGQPRRDARLGVLVKLAQLRGDDAAFDRLVAIAAHKPASTYLAWAKAVEANQDPVPVLVGGDDPVPVEPAKPAPQPQPGEAAPVEPEPVAVRPAMTATPMFRSLQDFKAMAGVGSRWVLRNWNHAKGEWGEPRIRTVAKVKARDLGFIQGDATALEAAAVAAEKQPGGLGWWGFPKQGEWESTPEGLLTRYPDGAPCMLLVPAPVADAPAVPVQPDGEVAALREMVAALSERLAKLEKAQEPVQTADALPDVEGVESSPASASGQNSTDCVPMVPRAMLDDALEVSEKRAKRIVELKVLVDELNDDRAAMQRRIGSLQTRVQRLTAVFAGAKRKLSSIGQDLLFARTKAAQLQRDLEAERAKPAQPVRDAAPSYNLDALRAG